MEKTALDLEGAPHIWSFQTDYAQLSRQHQVLQFARPRLSQDRCSAGFPYLVGETLAERLGRDIAGGKGPEAAVRQALDQLFAAEDGCRTAFVMTPELADAACFLPTAWRGLGV